MIIIVKDSPTKGQSRTGTDRMLRDQGWGSSFKSEEDGDKCAFLERKIKAHLGAEDTRVPAKLINRVR